MNESVTQQTEMEIDARRKDFLKKHWAIAPNIQNGTYPFKGIKLSRADVEWLLANQEHERGSVNGSEPSQGTRVGLDLRGANLRGVDLQALPLAGMRAGLTEEEWFTATPRQAEMAAADLEGANLSEASLDGTTFCRANLAKANLSGAFLRGADLFGANLKEACLYKTHLVGANLHRTNLEGAKISQTALLGAKVDKMLTEGADADRSIVPRKAKELKLPGSVSDWLKLLLFPLLLSVISIYISTTLSNRYAAVTLQVQNDQKAFEVKNNTLSEIGTIEGTALSELELIQHDQESKDFTVVLQNFSNAYRNFRIKGAELEAKLAAYFGDQVCSNINDRDHKGYNEIQVVWRNYHHSMLYSLYALSSNTDMSLRGAYIDDLKDVFSIYQPDQYMNSHKVNWDKLKTYYPFENTTILVKMNDEDDAWEGLALDIENYKDIIGTCILNATINKNALI